MDNSELYEDLARSWGNRLIAHYPDVKWNKPAALVMDGGRWITYTVDGDVSGVKVYRFEVFIDERINLWSFSLANLRVGVLLKRDYKGEAPDYFSYKQLCDVFKAAEALDVR